MFKDVEDKLKNASDKIKESLKGKLIYIPVFILAVLVLGTIIVYVADNMSNFVSGKEAVFTLNMIFSWRTLVIGTVIALIAILVMFITDGTFKNAGGILGDKGKDGDVTSVLENSRFLTDAERDSLFPHCSYEELGSIKNDGVPVRAVTDKKGKLQVNIMSGAHSLVVGSTGSGKTTTFVNPMIQIIAAANKGSSMIISDPKGELFDLHSGLLKKQGYKVLVFDMRDAYSSSRWNPLSGIWDLYQQYVNTGKDIVLHTDSIQNYPDLKLKGEPADEGEPWCEWNGCAYTDLVRCQDEVSVKKQMTYDEMYEDLNDMVSGICPITNDKDPLWEKGARSIIMATCLAMLEDSEDPRLGMTREKFNFFNVNKILTDSVNEYAAVKAYFEGRDPLSQAVTLSRQVLAAADQTMSSYMSITYDKLTIFNDRGICLLTSDTDINAADFASEPTALFLKIPDEKDTRHGLAALFILSTYKALIKVASLRPDLSLPRNVYFILDEFGNLPKIEKFGQMITVGRSRKIWFNMVIQSYAQLNAVYGEQVGDIIKSNCALKMFIGSNDINTCKEFSELCGNKTVRTSSTSSGIGSKEGDMNVSTSIQVRPLIYPSDLQKMNNKTSTGNAVIVTFGNYPLKTRYTPSYKCESYQFGRMDMTDIAGHVFKANEVYYNIYKRNEIVLEG